MSIGGKTVGILTLGCRVNQYESQAIAEALEARGIVIQSPSLPCDGYLIHTCAVTAESSRKSRQFIRRAIRTHSDAVIVVTGCEAERAASQIAKIPGVDAVVGNKQKMTCVELLCRLLAEGKASIPTVDVPPLADAAFEPMQITRSERTRAYVKIEDGCNGKCAYCIIAALRGPVRSRPIADVVREVQSLVAVGYKEVVLTGIETAAYAYGLDRLLTILHEIPELARIRLSSMDPAAITPQFVKTVASLPKVMPHYHLSLQSGCSATLARMRRRYNAEQARDAIKRLADNIPQLSLTADIIVGFPGETDAEFDETARFLSEIPLHSMHVFPFSPRPGTPAATMANQIDDATKHARLCALKHLADKRFLELGEGYLSKTVSVLFETIDKDGIGCGHAENMMEIRAPITEDQLGQILTVSITAVKKGHFIGTIKRKESDYETH